MKRRTFILTATVAAVAVAATPVIYSSCFHQEIHDPLATPEMLSHFCDKKILREIGIRYLKQVPGENEKQELIRLLLTDDTGKKTAISDNAIIIEFLEKRIKEEFAANRTIILNGWIISTTEARQCALLSLN